MKRKYQEDCNNKVEKEKKRFSNRSTKKVYSHKFEVEDIVEYQWKNKRHEFFVKWKGWCSEANTWEPLPHLESSSEILSNFLTKHLNAEKLQSLSQTFNIESCEKEYEYLNEIVSKKGFADIPDKFLLQINLLDLCMLNRKLSPTYLKKGKRSILQYLIQLKREAQLIYLKDWEDIIKKNVKEGIVIKVENNVDLEGPPKGFIYTNDYIPTDGVIIPDDPPIGCECETCNSLQKDCCGNQHCFAYGKNKRIRVDLGMPIYECNKLCKCGPECKNRVVQKDEQVPMCIFRTNNGRGWGVKALKNIYANQFVCKYVGEILSHEEAERRGKMYDKEGRTYLFDLDFNSADNVFTVDAATYGNVSHFFNHSCEPNLGVWAVWINCLDPNLPTLALFALHNIQKGEELTFDYTANSTKSLTMNKRKNFQLEISRSNVMNRPICKCNSAFCRQYLF